MNKKILVILVSLLIIISLSAVSAEKISATTADHFAYYGYDTPAGQSNYNYAIEVDSKVYYIPLDIADKLAGYSRTFRQVYEYDLDKFSSKFRPDAVSFGSNGFNAYYSLNSNYDDDMFLFVNDKAFDFEYKTGEQVGYNTDAKVITQIYYPNGGKITDTY